MHRHSSSFNFILLTKLELGPLRLGTTHVIRTAVGIVLMKLLSERVFFCFLNTVVAPGGVWTRLKTGSMTSSPPPLVQYAFLKVSYDVSINMNIFWVTFFLFGS
jgi:hypothetical protein